VPANRGAKERANERFIDTWCSLAFRVRNSLYAPKEQEYHEDQNDEAEAAARVVSPPGAVSPRRQSTKRNQEQNHNEYGNHVCIRPLSRGVQRSGLGAFNLRPRIRYPQASRNNPHIRVAEWVPTRIFWSSAGHGRGRPSCEKSSKYKAKYIRFRLCQNTGKKVCIRL
jgi:hypothetical protein